MSEDYDVDATIRLRHRRVTELQADVGQPTTALRTVRAHLIRLGWKENSLMIEGIDAALKGSTSPFNVLPLVWIECADDTHHDELCQYEIEKQGNLWSVVKAVTGGGGYLCHCADLDEAKSVAQKDHERYVRAAIGV